VFCRPPHFAGSVSGTDDTGHACRGLRRQRTDTEPPADSNGQSRSPSRSGVAIAAIITTMAGEKREVPSRTTSRGEAFGNTFGCPRQPTRA